MRKTISTWPSSISMRRTISRMTSRLADQSSRSRFARTVIEKSSSADSNEMRLISAVSEIVAALGFGEASNAWPIVSVLGAHGG